MKPEIVEYVIIAATLIILGWDLYLYKDEYPENTISQIIIKRTKKRPLIPLLWGFLMGHWFG